MIRRYIRHQRKATMAQLLNEPDFNVKILFARLAKHSKRLKQGKSIVALVNCLADKGRAGELIAQKYRQKGLYRLFTGRIVAQH